MMGFVDSLVSLLLVLLCAYLCRSPGGTPLRPKDRNQDAVNSDPGAIIAQALRRKFAHQVFQDSPGKSYLPYHEPLLHE